MTFLRSASVLLPVPRAATMAEVAGAPYWLGVCEYPGHTPAEMAIEVGSAALTAAHALPTQVRWVLHAGASVQGAIGWPVHHHIQHGIVGTNGNALELRQYCAGGLASWVVAAGLLADDAGVVVCTGADNWSFGGRFVSSATTWGEPYSDVAHAEVLSSVEGFAAILGTGTTSLPGRAEQWRLRDNYWEHPTLADYATTYARVSSESTLRSAGETYRMVMEAVKSALADAEIKPTDITHFVPHPTGIGQPYLQIAKTMGLPWSDALYRYHLAHGYLGVSAGTAALIRLAESELLEEGNIILMVATEFQLSSTAVVLRIIRRPALIVHDLITAVC